MILVFSGSGCGSKATEFYGIDGELF